MLSLTSSREGSAAVRTRGVSKRPESGGTGRFNGHLLSRNPHHEIAAIDENSVFQQEEYYYGGDMDDHSSNYFQGGGGAVPAGIMISGSDPVSLPNLSNHRVSQPEAFTWRVSSSYDIPFYNSGCRRKCPAIPRRAVRSFAARQFVAEETVASEVKRDCRALRIMICTYANVYSFYTQISADEFLQRREEDLATAWNCDRRPDCDGIPARDERGSVGSQKQHVGRGTAAILRPRRVSLKLSSSTSNDETLWFI